ncbi:MAG: cbb3-type cytochrome oxidase assembly protein CcoS [Candidatus Cyclonatronum sp.]|uniref:cbb3-type cytochrome oxidase assembly protein CcoS n=1 Tax=Cyclonatronum sp. TaxID=3024185 RepID=UPI0025C7365D|nr:cbb3-type cytochrome oxidase assembly protein CcoS [Cyclonatronum sp.]MCC5935254.1 cbb3-type cytochrome oxidase assembly protein CcoS [Balneolales bacterium]MCH8485818.1 cbb3-type cytochrome oxidase assembly protein CcoS [Cyclonatronum sp.]
MLLEQSISVSAGIWILLLFSLLIIVSGIALFSWAWLSGQFDDINKGAQLPFTEEEPAGEPTDQLFKPEEETHSDK